MVRCLSIFIRLGTIFSKEEGVETGVSGSTFFYVYCRSLVAWCLISRARLNWDWKERMDMFRVVDFLFVNVMVVFLFPFLS